MRPAARTRRRLALIGVVGAVAVVAIWLLSGDPSLERHPDLLPGPSLESERHVEIRGHSLVASAFDIRPGVDPFGFARSPGIPEWEPSSGDERLGLRLPYDWPAEYIERGHMFNPWTYQQNALVLCVYARRHGSSEPLESVVSDLVDRMLEYTVEVDDARFVVYRFEHSFEGTTVPSGWTSAYGNGVAMAGTLALHQCFGEQRYLDVVWELYEAFARFGEAADPLWVARSLEDGSVWFEELPLGSGLQPMVLNGHIYAVWALYDLYEFSGDGEVLELLRAGLTSIAHHGWRFRRPGETSLYDLRPPDTDDYGPARTINQQDVLCQMTEAQVFRDLRDEFAADMPEAASGVDFECCLES